MDPGISCLWEGVCVNISNDSVFAGNKVEGTECCERAILPEKALREKLNTVIEDEFSKVALNAVRIKHTSVFDKAKNCCSIFSYKKVCLFVCCLFVYLPKLQIHKIEGFEVKEFTFLSNDKLLELRGTRPRTNKGYSVSIPSKMAFL